MEPRRTGFLIAGIAVFGVVAALAAVMAMAADSMRPLALLWLVVPAPAVFAVRRFAPRLRTPLKRLSDAYLAGSAAVVAVVVLGVGWIGSERAIHPTECDDPPRLEDYPELEQALEPVTFTSRDGTKLYGWFIPGDSPRTIMVLHGYRCRREGMLPQASMLHRAGYSQLLFDFRAEGLSEGDAVTLGYYERGDALAAADYLDGRPDVDHSGYGVVGVSLGAATAILAAADSTRLAAVAVEAPYASLNSVIGQSFEYFVGLPAFPFAPITVWITERRVGFRSEDIVPERDVAGISPRPILIMHGALDTTISAADGRAIYAAAGEPKEFWLMPDVGHGQGAKKGGPEYERRLVEFFVANLPY